MDYFDIECKLKNPYLSAKKLEQFLSYFITDIFKTQVENNQEILSGIKYWSDFYNDIKHSKSWDDLKYAVNKYLIVKSNANVKSKYNIVINLSKAVTHQLWWKLNKFNNGETLEDGMKSFRQMSDQIAAEYNLVNGEILADKIDT